MLVRFALRLGVSEIQGRQNQKCTKWPQTELEHLTVKSTLYTLNTYLWGPNFGPFRPTASRFRDTKLSKSEKNRKSTEWLQNELEHLTAKITLYTLNTYPRYLILVRRFPRYRTFYNSALTPQKEQKKIAKNPKFEQLWILWTTLVQTLPGSMHEFLGANLLCMYFQTRCCLNFFSHVVPCYR